MGKTPRLGAGLSQGGANSECPPDNAAPDLRQPDLRASWLLRAAARYDQLHRGEISLDQAFDDAFVTDFLDALGICPCRHVTDNFDRLWLADRQQRLKHWRNNPRPGPTQYRPTEYAIRAFHYVRREHQRGNYSAEYLQAWLDRHPGFEDWLHRGGFEDWLRKHRGER